MGRNLQVDRNSVRSTGSDRRSIAEGPGQGGDLVGSEDIADAAISTETPNLTSPKRFLCRDKIRHLALGQTNCLA